MFAARNVPNAYKLRLPHVQNKFCEKDRAKPENLFTVLNQGLLYESDAARAADR